MSRDSGGRYVRRGRGAPLRNQNSVIHGLFAEYFNPELDEWLEVTTTEGLDEEVMMIRLLIRQVVVLSMDVTTREELIQTTDAVGQAGMRLAELLKAQRKIDEAAKKRDEGTGRIMEALVKVLEDKGLR